jgi:hypothetical protein
VEGWRRRSGGVNRSGADVTWECHWQRAW